MQKSAFTIEKYPKAYIGYYPTFKWKGWAMAHFELDEAIRIAEDFKNDEHPMSYDKGNDQFKVWNEGIGKYEFIKGENLKTEEGIKHLYPIGAGNWLWDNISDTKCHNLALEIEDFIWEFDTYHYQDECLVREETVEAIAEQLREATTFKKVWELWHGEELPAEELFEELGKELKI